MPGRNILKQDVAESYYHIYARGVNKQKIFRSEEDFIYFLSLLKRYLSRKATQSSRGGTYTKLFDDINLLTYCLMSNHFHLLVFQVTEKSMTQLMRGVMSSYSVYFNKKYHRRGPLFESRYRASRISSEQYLLHISRYIHLNPKQWRHYHYSSLSSYVDAVQRDWLTPTHILDLFSSPDEYLRFLEDYETERDALELIKHEIANPLSK